MSNEAKSKWNDLRREMFTGATTLIFGLASGGIVFCATLLTEEDARFGGIATVLFFLTVGGLIISLIAGVLLTVSRLEDFRATSRLVALSVSPGECDKKETLRLRNRAKMLGTASWWLFYIQLAGFSLGSLFLLFALWHLFFGVLFPPPNQHQSDHSCQCSRQGSQNF